VAVVDDNEVGVNDKGTDTNEAPTALSEENSPVNKKEEGEVVTEKVQIDDETLKEMGTANVKKDVPEPARRYDNDLGRQVDSIRREIEYLEKFLTKTLTTTPKVESSLGSIPPIASALSPETSEWGEKAIPPTTVDYEEKKLSAAAAEEAEATPKPVVVADVDGPPSTEQSSVRSKAANTVSFAGEAVAASSADTPEQQDIDLCRDLESDDEGVMGYVVDVAEKVCCIVPIEEEDEDEVKKEVTTMEERAAPEMSTTVVPKVDTTPTKQSRSPVAADDDTNKMEDVSLTTSPKKTKEEDGAVPAVVSPTSPVSNFEDDANSAIAQEYAAYSCGCVIS